MDRSTDVRALVNGVWRKPPLAAIASDRCLSRKHRVSSSPCPCLNRLLLQEPQVESYYVCKRMLTTVREPQARHSPHLEQLGRASKQLADLKAACPLLAALHKAALTIARCQAIAMAPSLPITLLLRYASATPQCCPSAPEHTCT